MGVELQAADQWDEGCAIILAAAAAAAAPVCVSASECA